MLAERDFMMNELDFVPVKRGRALLSERSVNIYSDMPDVVREGDIITMTGELIGFDNTQVELQWQYDDGMQWVDVPGANRLQHAFVATCETIDYSWRLSVTEVE